ncbi:MAG: VanZ family protein [Bacteroidota bacterium]
MLAFIPAFLWAGIIALMSLLPGKSIPNELFVVSDKLIHAIIYMVFTAFMVLALNYKLGSKNLNKNYIVSALIALVFGVLIEVFQESMKIGRSGDWKDAMADFVGIIVAYPLVKIVKGLRMFERILGK